MTTANPKLKNSAIVKDILIVPKHKGVSGGKEYILLATIVKDISRNKFSPGEEIRTSTLVKIDFEARIYETKNTIYYEE